MDRQSNGSFVVKDRVMDTHKIVSIVSQGETVLKMDDENNEVKIIDTNNSKEVRTLKNVDNKMMTIDEILNSMENK